MGTAEPTTGRMPLAAVVIDGAGLITHWNADAPRLFGPTAAEAVGRPAAAVLPASLAGGPTAGAGRDARDDGPSAWDDIDHLDPDRDIVVIFGADLAELSAPCSGRFFTHGLGDLHPGDVLWWAYPLLGPRGARLLLLAADGSRVATPDGPAPDAEGVAPAFVPHTAFAEADRLARHLPALLPPMAPGEADHVARRVLDLGYPALELTGGGRVPLAPPQRG